MNLFLLCVVTLGVTLTSFHQPAQATSQQAMSKQTSSMHTPIEQPAIKSATSNQEITKTITPPPLALIAQRADPSIYRNAGHYYFVATVPEYNRIELRAADTLKGLSSAPSKVVWKKHESGAMGSHIWAPEILQIDGVWYIYFAAGDVEDIWRIRMYVLTNKSSDPLKGAWEELGQVKTARESFSLDATSFVHKGQRYFLWAQKDSEDRYNSALYLAKLISPTKVGAVETMISKPDLDWEILGHKVNEGPAVIIRNNKVFISYSASATDHRYAVGLLWADANADLLDAKSWHKLPQPVFYTNEKLLRYGPGHNSFTLSEDGKSDVLVYHARDYLDLQGNPLSDPNRHTYIRSIKWTTEGFPDFGQEESNDLLMSEVVEQKPQITLSTSAK
jgi:GH43 family beta-xylosidase